MRTSRLPFLLIVFLLPAALAAQVVGGTISGRVTDSTGAWIRNAHVTIRDQDTGAERKLTTNSDGTFSAPSEPVGNYSVLASAPGFAPYKDVDVTLTVGQTLELTLELHVAGSETVTVVAAPLTVNTTTEQVAGLVTSRQVKDLPLNGRSYDQLITLNPGTVNATNQRSGGTGTSNSSVGSMFAVSGRRPQDNLFLLNGIEYTGACLINVTPGGTSGQLLGVDGIHEFNVITGTYSAAYGKRDGAQISIVTTSGTNQLHGSVYEFARNSFFDARNYFDGAGIPEFQRNNYGVALGGPLRRNYPGGSTAQRVAQYFNPNAFAAPAYGTVGNAGRDTLVGPHYADWDLSLLKSTQVTERVRAQFRAEFFNVLNHTNLQLPNEVVYSAGPTQGTAANRTTAAAFRSPGVISGTANTSRQIQLGLKLLF